MHLISPVKNTVAKDNECFLANHRGDICVVIDGNAEIKTIKDAEPK